MVLDKKHKNVYTSLRALLGVNAYYITNSAIDQFTRCVALELAPMGVRVNAINRGVIATNYRFKATELTFLEGLELCVRDEFVLKLNKIAFIYAVRKCDKITQTNVVLISSFD